MGAVNFDLETFDERVAETVLSWVGSREEADRWASAGNRALEPALLSEWHAEPFVHPYVGRAGGELVGYGEVWHDPDAGEAELARILVAPDRRGRGVGRRLVALLADRAREAGFDAIWLRVVGDNRAAIACYRAAGFVRASAAEETAFNEGQPTEYAWYRVAQP